MSDIVCISHLRWDFVWQRPQHLLARLARNRRVLFVEEPFTAPGATEPRLETRPGKGAINVTVALLSLPAESEYWIGHGDSQTQPAYTRLLKDYLAAESYEKPVLWMYTPMGLEFADSLPHSLLVYDVMDQLAAFKGAPPDLLQKEASLLKRADIVFTGGASIFRSKQPYNPNTHLFPSGVEIEHYAPAADRNAFPRPADMRDIQEPVLGYFGVIDERMDLELLAHLAAARPDWQLVMLGPVIKIDPAELPQAPNLHYLGMKSYEQLPAYLAHFDVALIPFALNEATRYLSPTKTLEYMAAHKPVVSNPINDVIELYGSVVRVARSPEEFVRCVEDALREAPGARRQVEDELLARYTWDNIAGEMGRLIEAEALKKS